MNALLNIFFGQMPAGGFEIRTIVELSRGDPPLGRAFWVRGIFGGSAVSLLCTLLP
jgi:hypothetical protein